jgi:hypothetical protein
LLLITLLRTLWRLSYQDMRDWLRDWPAFALACGLPLGNDGYPVFLALEALQARQAWWRTAA